MRILHVSQPTVAGVPTVVLRLVEDQVSRGWEVAVGCPDDGMLAAGAGAAGATVFRWPARRSPLRGVVPEAMGLRSVIRAFAPDVVHLHSAKAGLVGRLVLRGRVPTVFQPHAWSFHAAGHLRWFAMAWERLAARRTSLVVAVSDDEMRDGVTAGIRARYLVAPNGVDPTAFGRVAQREARAELGVVSDEVVICVGRLEPQKGQDLLLDAWPSVRARRPNAELFLVGDGRMRATLEARAVDGVRFVGESARVPLWLSSADVVALPSRWEAGSLALLEAMASAASVVVTDFQGARAAVQPGCGAVVPIDDAQALATEIVRRLEDVDLRAREGCAAAEVVRDAFDATTLSSVVGDAYGGLLRA